jgi:hypothetical protein
MAEAAADIDGALARLIDAGLQRVSTSLAAELEVLSQRAHHARLVSIERSLVALRTSVDRYLARDPDVGTDALIDRVARLSLAVDRLRSALEGGATIEEIEALVGRPRRVFTPVDESLLVVPVSLRVWRTESDFIGATVSLWSPARQRSYEASIARPVAAFGAEPRRLALMWINDAMGVTLQELSHGAWTLEGVKASADGRLSFPSDASARPAAASVADALQPLRCDGVRQVVARIASNSVDPLSEGAPEAVYLEIDQVDEPVVDELAGVATCAARDSAGARLRLAVPWRPENERWINNLRHLGRAGLRPDGYVGSARCVGDELHITPFTAVFREAVIRRDRRRTRSHLVHLGVDDLAAVDR